MTGGAAANSKGARVGGGGCCASSQGLEAQLQTARPARIRDFDGQQQGHRIRGKNQRFVALVRLQATLPATLPATHAVTRTSQRPSLRGFPASCRAWVHPRGERPASPRGTRAHPASPSATSRRASPRCTHARPWQDARVGAVSKPSCVGAGPCRMSVTVIAPMVHRAGPQPGRQAAQRVGAS